ncbi:MAG: esterase family protein [bacterium]|nr:esterase family protein [bacterium]
MALCTLHHYSATLNKMMAMNVILPEQIAGRLPVYYLLHGLSDDYTAWQRRSNIERYVEGMPLIVVMPDGGRYFYCDCVDGPQYESYMIKELIPYIDALFPTVRKRSGRAIGGLSMGGYGAVKLALKFPDLFISVNGHSGAYDIARRSEPVEGIPEWRQIFGWQGAGGKDDVFELARRCDPTRRPALRIDCGVDDFLLEANRRFHEHLVMLGYPHEYEEFPGAHTWAYWDAHVPEALAFHQRHLECTEG